VEKDPLSGQQTSYVQHSKRNGNNGKQQQPIKRQQVSTTAQRDVQQQQTGALDDTGRIYNAKARQGQRESRGRGGSRNLHNPEALLKKSHGAYEYNPTMSLCTFLYFAILYLYVNKASACIYVLYVCGPLNGRE
jgi:hypothetical protein